MYVLHDHQCAGPNDAGALSGVYRRARAEKLSRACIDFYFFTDDNFARKRWWRETFEAIIRLRDEGIKISFMMQVDLARKPKDFVRLAAEAGCSQVFIGMESVNPENLTAEGKPQNKVEQYVDIMR